MALAPHDAVRILPSDRPLQALLRTTGLLLPVVPGGNECHLYCLAEEDNAMNDTSRHTHWEQVYTTKGEREVSWFQESAEPSMELLRAAGASADTRIIDIGGGASRLVDTLVRDGFQHVTVLDLSEAALSTARARLGARAETVQWIAADVTRWEPAQTFDVWHDRAAFHFLTEDTDRAAYVDRLRRAVRPGGMSSSVHSRLTARNDAAGWLWFATAEKPWPTRSAQTSSSRRSLISTQLRGAASRVFSSARSAPSKADSKATISRFL